MFRLGAKRLLHISEGYRLIGILAKSDVYINQYYNPDPDTIFEINIKCKEKLPTEIKKYELYLAKIGWYVEKGILIYRIKKNTGGGSYGKSRNYTEDSQVDQIPS